MVKTPFQRQSIRNWRRYLPEMESQDDNIPDSVVGGKRRLVIWLVKARGYEQILGPLWRPLFQHFKSHVHVLQGKIKGHN